MSAFYWILIFALGAMLVNSVGIWVIYKYKDWAERAKVYFMCFAAGVLISSPLIMAFPEALQRILMRVSRHWRDLYLCFQQ